MPHADVNGLSIHYQQAGQGPDVVLIHAVTSNMAVWLFTGLMDQLAADYRVTAYDMRGHGASDAPPSGYTSADMAADFLTLRRELDIGPAALVGHSFGAVVAMHLAAEHPEHVRGVILSDPYFPGLRHLEPDLGQSHVWAETRDLFRHADIDLGDELNFTKLFRTVAGLTRQQKDRMQAAVGPGPVRWLAGLPKLADTTCGGDVFEPAGLDEAKIRSVSVPVVALYDEHTAFTQTRGWLEKNLPRCTVDIVPGARHVAPLQNPVDFTRLVRAHLGTLAAPN